MTDDLEVLLLEAEELARSMVRESARKAIEAKKNKPTRTGGQIPIDEYAELKAAFDE